MQCKGQGYMMLKDTTCKHLWKLILPFEMSPCGLLLVLQILPLWNQTPKRKTLVAQGSVKFCDPLYVEWNRSQNLTLTLHRLSSP